MIKSFLQRASRNFRVAAWYVGGQKQHKKSNLRIPPGGHIADDVSIIFPEAILLGKETIILSAAKLICASMPPYVRCEGKIEVGESSIIRENVILHTYGGVIKVGRSCTINPFTIMQGNGGLTIGDNVLIAAQVGMFSANHIFADRLTLIREQGEAKAGIVIEDDVWIGAGVKILSGVTIGRGAVVAAGAVVNRNIPAFEIHAGVPARKIGSRN